MRPPAFHRAFIVRALALGLLCASPAAASAEGFQTANMQLLQGFTFRDAVSGNDTDDGLMTTLTFNYFGTWEWGDHFFFADISRGSFVTPPGVATTPAKIYAEWHPRLLVGKALGRKQPFGPFRDFGPTFEVNQSGDGFYAYLAGASADLALPLPYVVGFNAYYRFDRFVRSTWQFGGYWDLPFKLGPVPMVFAGFIDVAGAEDAQGDAGVDITTQPELLVDVLALLGGKPRRLFAGAEWFVHRHPIDGASALQAMVQWTFQ